MQINIKSEITPFLYALRYNNKLLICLIPIYLLNDAIENLSGIIPS
jgi:hypothetical protein